MSDLMSDTVEAAGGCPKCCVCGQRATHAVRDYYQWDDRNSPYLQAKPAEMVRFGCDEHQQEAQRIDISEIFTGVE